IALVFVATATAAGAATGEPLKLGFAMRPGLAELADGVPVGTYLPLAANIARAAHLDVQWQVLPQIRLIEEVRVDTPNYCAVGIYKTPDRAAFSKFTLAFYRDKPLIVVAMKSKEAAIRKHASFAALAADTNFKAGLLEGFSYGPKLDAILAKMTGNAERMAGSSMQNVSKLALGRYDYIVAASDESPRSVAGADVNPNDLVAIEFADMAPGASRHFMCSKSVDDATVKRLDAAIRALHLPPRSTTPR
ncbi:MAG TPA: hypothetical protein VK832_20640, partial [Burkholderiaceae bacterium]|nr:hypothetical protein [Burkholderiaceae bacterium]